MLKIKQLYSDPEIFKPVIFTDGFNLILGETTEKSVKTNGVGKSLCIEFLNYGLLKRHSDSRVSLIPENDMSYDTVVCLDFEINNHKITVKRCIKSHDSPVLIVDGNETRYSDIDDAKQYLTTLLFGSSENFSIPSFRQILGPLIRDEGSEFKSIINCFDTSKRIPPDYTSHLYLLHIDPQPYVNAKALYTEIQNISKARKKMKENIQTITGKNVSESKSDLNELESQVIRIQSDVDKLENIEGYDAVKQEIIDIETSLEQERSQRGVLNSELSKIKLFRGDNYIDDSEVTELYNQFKDGLGDLIQRELQEVTSFKKKIDDFQRTLIDGRRNGLSQEISVIDNKIVELNRSYKEKLSLLDQEGLLRSLKQTIAIHQQKIEEHSALSSFIKKYNDYDNDRKAKRRLRDENIFLLETYKNNSISIIESVEQTILDIHEYVIGNRKCSFDVEVSKNNEVLKFELRTDDDGSHSINREKVFLYDLALLTNEDTSDRHPKLLIHDNIFDVDQDTLVKSLNYIGDHMRDFNKKQYILTINSDRFSEKDHEHLNISLEDYTVASFTKSDKFLKFQYQEVSR